VISEREFTERNGTTKNAKEQSTADEKGSRHAYLKVKRIRTAVHSKFQASWSRPTGIGWSGAGLAEYRVPTL
jgi:hypothetical protein